MGTNYYLMKSEAGVCEHCGQAKQPAEELHIGKSSAGWCFSLHVMPEDGINDLADWLPLFEKYPICNEYGETISAETMREVITCRAGGRPHSPERFTAGGFYSSEAEFHARNYSERGPNDLLRHRVGPHCLKHGAGTWDCMTGVFS